jgi:hypothetical protein
MDSEDGLFVAFPGTQGGLRTPGERVKTGVTIQKV